MRTMRAKAENKSRYHEGSTQHINALIQESVYFYLYSQSPNMLKYFSLNGENFSAVIFYNIWTSY